MGKSFLISSISVHFGGQSSIVKKTTRVRLYALLCLIGSIANSALSADTDAPISPDYPDISVAKDDYSDLLGTLSEPFSTSEPSFEDQFSVQFTPNREYQPYGPLFSKEYEYQSGNTHTRTTFPPLFSYENYPELEVSEFDVLYPIFGIDHFGFEKRTQFCQIFNWISAANDEDKLTRRYTIYPLLFIQRSEEPDNDYFAVMPFYGNLTNRMWRHEVHFIMAPFYVKTRLRDVVTKNYLYPFVHTRTGDQLMGWQVWPFVSSETRIAHTKEDIWGDPVFVPGHRKQFILWPIALRYDKDIGTDNPKEFRAILPFYAQMESPQRDNYIVMGLLYNQVDDRAQRYREWDAPYPLIAFARGEGKTTNRIFPFYSESFNEKMHNDFLLWPLWKTTASEYKDIKRRRERVLFYLYSDVQEHYASTQQDYHRTDVWPLISAKENTDGTYKVDMLSPFEPFFHNNKSIERNWTPSASIWSLEENIKNEELKEAFFWNLYRHEENKKTKRWSFFFGMFEKVRDAELGTYWRIFYAPDKRRQADLKLQKQNEAKENAPANPLSK